MQRRDLLRSVLAAGTLTASGLPLARAQGAAWPQRPIKLVVPYPAGSSPDVVARLLAGQMEKALGQPIVIDNRAGAGGTLGTGVVAKATADDHTFLFTTQSPLVTAPLLMKQLPYDPFTELAPVTQVATSPLVLAVDPRLGANNVRDFVRLAKASNGSFNYASTGIGQATHLSMELFKTRAGFDILHVPFQSSPQAVTAMLGGQIQASFMVPGVAMGHVQAGKLTVVGVTSAQRLPGLPDVPTIAEQGYPDYESVAWHAVLAPARTHPAVLERMAAEAAKVIGSSGFRTPLAAQYFAPTGGGPAELAAIMKRESALWGKVIQAAGIQPS
ncbi:tripartite tricarboxylate transporter substrate-binding protein [Hydrogenophaga sp.]|uniref:Bug family tripartite tricarboxylate transporter substrate binding protein n=1 Tax=Hydrogenophaga sp. TaxID=1904254 RepID=UPI002602C689|nr:tripartite tricarboxylate transporter substrate-binding protein [Hydrogenophaga sp.]MCW5655641.1 tripartite tricarboxylate transporter substrate binding protein [Hydrogenophaga sp.]